MLFFQRNWSPLFFISRSSSFSVIHVNVEINKAKSKEKSALLLFFISNFRVAMRFNTETRVYLKCKFHSAYMKGVDVRRDVRKIF